METDVASITRLTAGVDWLTVTVKDWDKRDRMKGEIDRIFERERGRGLAGSRWSFKGYAGLRMNGTRWGTRFDSDICMLSGSDACINWPAFLAMSGNVTRLDLAVTVELCQPIANLAKICYDYILEERRAALSSNWRQYTYYENTNGGQTLYVGSRASDQYGRLYDKAAEQEMSDHIAKLWRYEIEFKTPRSQTVADGLWQRSKAGGGVAGSIARTVELWFEGRDIPVIFENAGDALATEVTATVQSNDTTLNWLSTQVRPALQRLRSQGLIVEALTALGIEDAAWWLVDTLPDGI